MNLQNETIEKMCVFEDKGFGCKLEKIKAKVHLLRQMPVHRLVTEKRSPESARFCVLLVGTALPCARDAAKQSKTG